MARPKKSAPRTPTVPSAPLPEVRFLRDNDKASEARELIYAWANSHLDYLLQFHNVGRLVKVEAVGLTHKNEEYPDYSLDLRCGQQVLHVYVGWTVGKDSAYPVRIRAGITGTLCSNTLRDAIDYQAALRVAVDFATALETQLDKYQMNHGLTTIECREYDKNHEP